MIWIVNEVVDFVYTLCSWLVGGIVSGVVGGCCGVLRGLDYTVKHKGFWILTSLFLGWYFSLHLSLMKTIDEFQYGIVTVTNTTFSNSSLLLDDVLNNTIVDPEVFSTLEVDDAAEFFGVEKNVMKVHLYYLVSTIVAFCVTLIILFITEVIYFCTFGRVLFGHTVHSNKMEQIMGDIKIELVKIADAFKNANRDNLPAIAEIVHLLKEIRDNRVFATITDGASTPSTPSMIENGDTSETTQASENSSEMGEVDSPHPTHRAPVVTTKSKKRKAN